jgi:hypothetical protein
MNSMQMQAGQRYRLCTEMIVTRWNVHVAGDDDDAADKDDDDVMMSNESENERVNVMVEVTDDRYS